jgi:hypothetical protein
MVAFFIYLPYMSICKQALNIFCKKIHYLLMIYLMLYLIPLQKIPIKRGSFTLFVTNQPAN